MNVRRIYLPVRVSSVSLAARVPALGVRAHKEAVALAFSGWFGSPMPDWSSNVSTIDERLAGLAVNIRCAPDHDADDSRSSGMGWLQFCPIAPDLGANVEVWCCTKRFASIKNAIHFGHGRPGARLTLELEIEEDDKAGTPRGAVARYPVMCMSLNVALGFEIEGDFPVSEESRSRADFSSVFDSVPL